MPRTADIDDYAEACARGAFKDGDVVEQPGRADYQGLDECLARPARRYEVVAFERAYREMIHRLVRNAELAKARADAQNAANAARKAQEDKAKERGA